MKRQILFVDDEEKIIEAFKRLLHSYKDEWIITFANSGKEALNILSSNNIDIIISDMWMPEMSGVELLSFVKNMYPHVIRIILSGYSDQGVVLKTPKIAHRFIAKPFDSKTLILTIENVLELKKRFINSELLAVVAGLDNLPSLPEFFDELKNEINSSNASIKRIGKILSQDVAMTAKILQLVNSAFFGLPQKILDPVQAINFLGIEVIKSLVLFEKIFSSLNSSDPYKIFYDEVYNHSIRAGNLARKITLDELGNKSIADEAFIGGLLHDVGKLVCLRLTDYPIDIRKNMKLKGMSYIESEIELYDSTHCEIGTYLLHLWGLPETITKVTEHHHNPGLINNDEFDALSAVYIANSIINKTDFDCDYIKRIGVQAEKYQSIN